MRDQLSNLNSFPHSHGDSVAQGARRDQTGCGSTVRLRLTVLVWFIQQGFSRRNTLWVWLLLAPEGDKGYLGFGNEMGL